MTRLKKLLPLVFLALCAAGAGWVALNLSLHGSLGPQCELKENFASAGRPAYWHRCACLGIRYNQNPPPWPGADATRCFGLVKKSWTDTDEIALKVIEERERAAKSQHLFERLSPEAQKKVEAAYKKLRQGAFRNDYEYMLEQARIILLEVDDYGETRALETMAKEAIERQKNPPAPEERGAKPVATESSTGTALSTGTETESVPEVIPLKVEPAR